MTRPAASTLGELRASGWRRRSVKEEMRANLLDRIRRGEPLLPGILGYDETVLPQIENAILAGQDIILLGERGQAKSRIPSSGSRARTAMPRSWRRRISRSPTSSARSTRSRWRRAATCPTS
jgi:hypothetical protein